MAFRSYKQISLERCSYVFLTVYSKIMHIYLCIFLIQKSISFNKNIIPIVETVPLCDVLSKLTNCNVF